MTCRDYDNVSDKVFTSTLLWKGAVVIYCKNVKMCAHLSVFTVPHVSEPLVKGFSCNAVISEKVT
jgi:hypothetical protein